MAARARWPWLASMAMVLLLVQAAPALAAGKHYQWRTMSLAQRINAQQHLVAHDRQVIRAWLATRWHLTNDPAVSWAYPAVLAKAAPPNVWWHERHLAWTLRELHKSLRLAKAARAAAAVPAHNALWECIHPREASDPHNMDTGHNGHYGGLQMSYGWLGIVPGNPASYSWLQQKVYAEQGYRASGYSRAWLQGQWGQTIGPCWGYA